MKEEITQKQALEVLIQVANLAQSKGILSLGDAVTVAAAIKVFVDEPVEEVAEAKE